MAKTSPAKLLIFFIFFASVRILENLLTISAVVDHKIPRNSSSGADVDPCQKGPWKYAKAEVGKVEGNCDESDMANFTNAVSCTKTFLLDQRPYHAASFVYDFHRQNAGKIGFFAEALLQKLDLDPSFINKCTRKGDREMVLEDYHRGRDLMLEELDKLGIFEVRDFHTYEEDEYKDEDTDDDVEDDDDNEDEDTDDDVEDDDDNDDDLSNDDESDQDIEVNFLD